MSNLHMHLEAQVNIPMIAGLRMELQISGQAQKPKRELNASKSFSGRPD